MSNKCLYGRQGGIKRCSTVASLRGKKAEWEAQRRRNSRGREEKRKKGVEKEEEKICEVHNE